MNALLKTTLYNRGDETPTKKFRTSYRIIAFTLQVNSEDKKHGCPKDICDWVLNTKSMKLIFWSFGSRWGCAKTSTKIFCYSSILTINMVMLMFRGCCIQSKNSSSEMTPELLTCNFRLWRRSIHFSQLGARLFHLVICLDAAQQQYWPWFGVFGWRLARLAIYCELYGITLKALCFLVVCVCSYDPCKHNVSGVFEENS